MTTSLWVLGALLALLLLIGGYRIARRHSAGRRHGKEKTYFHG